MGRYLAIAATSLVTILTITAAFNLWIDPYGFRTSGPQPSAHRTEFSGGLHLAKPHRVRRQQPNTLFLGSSRVGEGFHCDMQSQAKCYNGAYAGGSLYQALRLLQEAVPAVERVYLGLDFEAALAPKHEIAGFMEARFSRNPDLSDNSEYALQNLRDYVTVTLSTDTTTAAAISYWQSDPTNSFRRILRSDGSWELPQQTDSKAQAGAWQMVQRFSRSILRGYLAIEQADIDASMNAYLTQLQRIEQLARQHDFELLLFINPTHSDYLNLVNELGGEQLYLVWLTLLKDKLQTEVRNFSGMHRYSRSPRPDAQNGLNPWFNDPVHFSPALGRLMLEQMEKSCEQTESYFGRCISDYARQSAITD